jgi:UDP-galactopyranose mutase
VLNISHAYVIYDAWRDKNLNKIHQRLQEHSIHSVGRYGEWKYSSMQEAVLDGKATAQTLLVRPAQKIIEPKIYIPRTQPQKEISNG